MTTGKGFGGLASYLSEERERVAWSETRNLVLEDPRGVAREMRAAANRSARVEKPVYHLSISFDSGDRPTRAQMQQAADRVLKELGLERHQAYLVAHKDKEHPHVHVMVNRVHPETGRAWNAHQDYPRIERSLRDLEKEWAMRRVPGRHGREAGAPEPDRTASHATGEVRRERRTGERPLSDEIRERVGKELKEASGWGELMQTIREHGYRLEARESGMVLTDGRRYAKASGVDPGLSQQRLEGRFGQGLSDFLPKDRPPLPGRERAGDVAPGGRGASRGERDSKVEAVLKDLRAYEQVKGKEMELALAARTAGELSGRLREVPHLEARAGEQSRAFGEALAGVYREPAAARAAFEKMAEQEGTRAAFEAMRSDPKRFGALLEVERRRWLGLKVEADKSEAVRAAQGAAHRGRDYLTAKGRVPSAGEVERMRSTVEHAECRIAELKRDLQGRPRAEVLYWELGERAARLTGEQMGRLERALPVARMGAVKEAASRVVELAKGRER